MIYEHKVLFEVIKYFFKNLFRVFIFNHKGSWNKSWPSMNLKVIFYFTKSLRFHNESFHQNISINGRALYKRDLSQDLGVTKFLWDVEEHTLDVSERKFTLSLQYNLHIHISISAIYVTIKFIQYINGYY